MVGIIYGNTHGQGVIVLVGHGQFSSTRILQEPRFPINLEKRVEENAMLVGALHWLLPELFDVREENAQLPWFRFMCEQTLKSGRMV